MQYRIELSVVTVPTDETGMMRNPPPPPALSNNIAKVEGILTEIIALTHEDVITITKIGKVNSYSSYHNSDHGEDGENSDDGGNFDVTVESSLPLDELKQLVTESIEIGPDTWMEGDIYAVGYVNYRGRKYLSEHDYEYRVELDDVIMLE